MSRLFKRLGRSMSTLVVGLLTIALLGALGTSLAFAAPASASSATSEGSGYHQQKPHLTCNPKDPHLNGGCELKFNDITDPNGNKGLIVCFSTPPKNIVVGANKNCSPENAGGNAFGVFLARTCGRATIYALVRNKVNGKVHFRTANVVVDVVCARRPAA